MGMLKKTNTSMISALLLLFTTIASVSGVCEDDLVSIEAKNLPARWNLGTIPHLFFNSEHLRGVMSVSDTKIIGLDTVVTSFHFCPPNMTIYGNLTAGRLGFVGKYTANLDWLTQGQDTFSHGQGNMDINIVNLEMKNMVIPLRYSSITKKLQIDDAMRYEITDKVGVLKVTGFETDHLLSTQEFIRLDRINSLPLLAEFMRSVINTKAQKGILLTAAKTLFVSAVGQ